MISAATARMALARDGRVSSRHLRWQPYIEPEFTRFECLVCADPGVKEAVLEADGHALFMCRGCGSHQCWPAPPVSWDATPADVAVDHYLQRGAGLGILARHVSRLVADRLPGRFLDVGCGVGFAVDMARRRGWQAYGVEPSGFGRAGAELLGIAMFPGTLEALGESGAADYEAVLCAETIAHTPNPAGFLGLLWRRVAPGGRLLLTAPDCASLYRDDSESRALALLGPRDRFFLPSRDGLAALLARAGCPPARITEEDGSLVAELARPSHDGAEAPARAPVEEDGHALVVGYLRAVLQGETSERMRLAANLRLLALHGDRGEWPQAADARRGLAAHFRQATQLAGHAGQPSLIELHSMMPPGLPAAMYYEAMASLNFDADPSRAAVLFETTAGLSMLSWRTAPSVFLGEKDISDNARFHAALARAYAGQVAAARRAAEALVADATVGELWRERARQEVLR